MVTGRARELWQHSAYLVAGVANLLGGKVSPDSINPFVQAEREAKRKAQGAAAKSDDPMVIDDPKEGFAVLKEIFREPK